MGNRLRWLLLALSWMALIFWFSSQSTLLSVPDHWLDLILKKSAHAFAYGLLWYFWFRTTGHPLLALLFSIAYAISDEWHQTFVPGRQGWWVDVVIDTVGALAAMLITTLLLSRNTILRSR